MCKRIPHLPLSITCHRHRHCLDLDLTASLSLSKRALSFLPPPPAPLLESLLLLLCPCTLPSTTSASSAAALSKPRSAKPSSRRAARATRYRVLTRAGAGVRLGMLCVGEERARAQTCGIEVRGTVGAEDERHVTDTLAVRHRLRIQRDMDNRRVIVVL
ncbi:hypothetical protein BJV74DRAFT_462698 [Russula compacta]|nr:hypothetical protein BJV74DRAFT_462698 [Russula compacta]